MEILLAIILTVLCFLLFCVIVIIIALRNALTYKRDNDLHHLQ
jgi:uncharacterized protein YneF (UPF0154 family)